MGFLREGRDFISLTWIEGKGIVYWKDRYSKDFTWKLFETSREKNKGKAKGWILIEVRKSGVEKKDVEISKVDWKKQF